MDYPLFAQSENIILHYQIKNTGVTATTKQVAA